MSHKPILAIALASAFAVTSLGAYAQEDEKKPYVISQSDEKKDEKKPYQSDEKEPKKPELIGNKGDGNRNEPPYPIQSDFEMHS
jgi:hypothetical protein